MTFRNIGSCFLFSTYLKIRNCLFLVKHTHVKQVWSKTKIFFYCLKHTRLDAHHLYWTRSLIWRQLYFENWYNNIEWRQGKVTVVTVFSRRWKRWVHHMTCIVGKLTKPMIWAFLLLDELIGYLSSFHDLLCFGIEVEISPQGFEQHLLFDAHSLAVDVSKLLDATKHSKLFSL